MTYTFYSKKELENQINLDFKFKKNIKIVKGEINLKKIHKLNFKDISYKNRC